MRNFWHASVLDGSQMEEVGVIAILFYIRCRCMTHVRSKTLNCQSRLKVWRPRHFRSVTCCHWHAEILFYPTSLAFVCRFSWLTIHSNCLDGVLRSRSICIHCRLVQSCPDSSLVHVDGITISTLVKYKLLLCYCLNEYYYIKRAHCVPNNLYCKNNWHIVRNDAAFNILL